MKAKVSCISAIICLITLVFFCILACDNGSVSDSASSKSSDLIKVSLVVDDGSSGFQKAISISSADLKYMYKAVPQWTQNVSIQGSTNNQFVQIPGYSASTPTPLGYFAPGQWRFYIQVLNGSTLVYEGHSDVSISASQANIIVTVSKITQGAIPGVVSIEVTAPTINNTDTLTIAWDGTASETGAAVQGSGPATATPDGSITTFTYEKNDLPVGTYTFTFTHNNVNGRGGTIAVDVRQGENAVISGCLDNGEWQLGRISLTFHSVSIDIYDWGTVPDPYYGDVDIDVDYTVSGDKVSVATRPSRKAHVAELTVTCDSDDEPVEYTRVGDLYTFNMPDDDVTVHVTFAQAAVSGQVDVMLFRTVVQALYSEYHNAASHIDFCKAAIPNQITPIVLNDVVEICYDNVSDPSNPKICWDSAGDMTLSAGSLADLFKNGLKYRSINMSGIDASAVTDMSGMFEGCTNLSNVSFANFTTSTTNGINMARMFKGCTNLATANLNLTGFVNSKASSMASMFQGSTSLATLNLSGFNAGSATDMSSMFEGCTGLTSVTLPVISSPTISVNMAGLFKGCTSLTTLGGLSTFKTNRATSLASMFQGCTSLASLDLSDLNASNATDISEMFQGCTNLTTLDLSNFDASSATDISDMFRGCTSLASLDLSNFDVSSATDISEMFQGCTALTTLNLSGFAASSATDMSDIFQGCTSLATLNLSGADLSSVTDISDIFQVCTSLATLYLSGADLSSVTDMSALFQGCTSLATVDLSDFDASGATDMSDMFRNCTNLVRLYLDGFIVNNSNNIEVNMQGLFRGCENLRGNDNNILDLSSFDTSKVTDMSYMFCKCKALTQISFGANFDTSHVTDMSYMFSSVEQGTAGGAANKMNLTSLNVSGFTTPNVTNMTHMFYMCSDLTTLAVSQFDTKNVTDMSYMFGCWVGAPSHVAVFDLSGWDFSKVTTVNRMFDRCEYATTITFPSRTKWSRIEDMLYLFSNCYRLTRAKLKNIIKTWDFSGHNNVAALRALFSNVNDTDSETSPNNRLIKNNMCYSKHKVVGGADFDTREEYPTLDTRTVDPYPENNTNPITKLYIGGDITGHIMYQRLTTVQTPPPTP